MISIATDELLNGVSWCLFIRPLLGNGRSGLLMDGGFIMPMSVRVYLSGNTEHDRVLRAFYEGCPSPNKALISGWRHEPSDVAVIFGVFKSRVPTSWPRGRIFSQQRKNNLDVVVLETGYINRGDGENHHYAAGFNGLNGRADFRNADMPDDRAILLRRDYGLRLLRWREKGRHILLCGQVPWDASVDHSDHIKWLAETVAELRRRAPKRKIRFRPHPMVKLKQIEGCEYSEGPVWQDLQDAHAVVTFNSNMGVDATIYGVPAICVDEGSMVWNLCSRLLAEIENPMMLDRESWVNSIAYTQWTLDEMRGGATWSHLFRLPNPTSGQQNGPQSKSALIQDL